MEIQGKEPERRQQIGLVIVTHVDYGAALFRAAEHILGPVSDCATIQVDIADNVEETVGRLQYVVEQMDSGMGVIILTDMFGGTPTNLSLSLLKKFKNIEVITGVNLPMLLKLLGNRDKTMAELAEIACEAGQEGIAVAGELLRKTMPKSDDA